MSESQYIHRAACGWCGASALWPLEEKWHAWGVCRDGEERANMRRRAYEHRFPPRPRRARG